MLLRHFAIVAGSVGLAYDTSVRFAARIEGTICKCENLHSHLQARAASKKYREYLRAPVSHIGVWHLGRPSTYTHSVAVAHKFADADSLTDSVIALRVEELREALTAESACWRRVGSDNRTLGVSIFLDTLFSGITAFIVQPPILGGAFRDLVANTLLFADLPHG
jgi:hypothetical protein